MILVDFVHPDGRMAGPNRDVLPEKDALWDEVAGAKVQPDIS